MNGLFLRKNMRKIIALALFICAGISFSPAQSMKKGNAILRHVVMFKFQDKASSKQIKEVEDAFHALPGKIKLIKDFEWGVNNSPENLNQGLTHCFFVTFTSEKDRDAYLIHPDHKAFVEVLKPYVDKATVLDYWAHK